MMRSRFHQAIMTVAVLWVVLFFFAFQPGILSPDSVSEFAQGLSGTYGTLHPPLHSIMMGMSGKLFGSPLPLFFLQLVLFAGGVAFLATRVDGRGNFPTGLIFVFLLFLPSTWTTSITHWKDTWLTLALLATVIAIWLSRPWLALSMMVLASCFRHNGMFPAFALLPLWFSLLRLRWGGRKAGLASLVAIGLVGISPKLVERFVGAKDEWALAQLLIFDLSGIYYQNADAGKGKLLDSILPVHTIASIYDYRSVTWTLWGNPRIDLDQVTNRRTELVQEWMQVIAEHPKLYVKHRLLFFTKGFLTMEGVATYPYQPDVTDNAYGFRLWPGTVRHIFETFRNKCSASVLFMGWAWTLVSLAIAVATAFRIRQSPMAFWVAVSGLAQVLPNLVIGIASDFRYFHWAIVSAAIALFLVYARPRLPITTTQQISP